MSMYDGYSKAGLIFGNSGGGGGGTTDYTQLTNKPKINGTTVVGELDADAFGLANSYIYKLVMDEDNNRNYFIDGEGEEIDTADVYSSMIEMALASNALGIINLTFAGLENTNLARLYYTSIDIESDAQGLLFSARENNVLMCAKVERDDVEVIIRNVSDVQNYITPEQYGAVADGETDDTQAFNDMFDDISDYAVIYLTGKYKLTNNIDVGNAVDIIGNDGAVLYCRRFKFEKSVHCKNVTFDAEDNTNDSMGVVVCEASDSVFDGCSVINNKNGRCGIAFANENSAIQNISVNNCYFENIGSSAIELFFEVKNARITNNTCVDCAINTNLDDGVISTYGDYHRGQIAKDIFISDNIINNSVDSKAFIRLNGVDNAVVKNNICKSTAIAMTASAVLVSDRTNHDIKVYNKNIVISDNIIENNSTDGATIFVRSVDSNSEFNCKICNNKITNNTGKCIGLSNTLEDCYGKITITDNDLKSEGVCVDTSAGTYAKDFDFIFRGNRVDSDNTGIHIVTSGIIDICNNRIVTSGRAISVGDTATSAGGKVNIADNTIIEGNGCIFNSTSEIFVYNNMIKSTVQNAIALYVSDSVAIMNNIISGPANVRILKVSGTYLVDPPVNTIIQTL